jgi:hypothetical protein
VELANQMLHPSGLNCGFHEHVSELTLGNPS